MVILRRGHLTRESRLQEVNQQTRRVAAVKSGSHAPPNVMHITFCGSGRQNR